MFTDRLLSFIVSTFPRGTVFFSEMLDSSGLSPDNIRACLSKLVTQNCGVIRLGRGIYFFAEHQDAGGRPGKLILPSVEEVAFALAARYRVSIVPTSIDAAYLAGLIPHHGNSYTWASSGHDQTFRLKSGDVIYFKRKVCQRVFTYSSPTMRNLVEGLKYIGKEESLKDETAVVIHDNLMKVSSEDFEHDIILATLWVRELLTSLKSR